jgi:hypothetical protein
MVRVALIHCVFSKSLIQKTVQASTQQSASGVGIRNVELSVDCGLVKVRSAKPLGSIRCPSPEAVQEYEERQ